MHKCIMVKPGGNEKHTKHVKKHVHFFWVEWTPLFRSHKCYSHAVLTIGSWKVYASKTEARIAHARHSQLIAFDSIAHSKSSAHVRFTQRCIISSTCITSSNSTVSRASHKGRLKLKSLSKDADTMVCHLDPPEGGIFGDK